MRNVNDLPRLALAATAAIVCSAPALSQRLIGTPSVSRFDDHGRAVIPNSWHGKRLPGRRDAYAAMAARQLTTDTTEVLASAHFLTAL